MFLLSLVAAAWAANPASAPVAISATVVNDCTVGTFTPTVSVGTYVPSGTNRAAAIISVSCAAGVPYRTYVSPNSGTLARVGGGDPGLAFEVWDGTFSALYPNSFATGLGGPSGGGVFVIGVEVPANQNGHLPGTYNGSFVASVQF